MSTSLSFYQLIADQLDDLGVSFRKMMGEYLVYQDGTLLGGLYDDRFLVKITPGTRALLPEAQEEIPYPGAKPMLLVSQVEDREALRCLVSSISEVLRKDVKK